MVTNLELGVGISVFNGERYIDKVIESLLNQTSPNFKLVAVKNASTNTTTSIVESYCRMDNRVSLHVDTENIGAAKNYHTTFAGPNAEYFRWHNSDDLIASNLHERCLGELKQNPSAVLAAGTTTTLIDENGKEVGQYHDNLDLRQPTPIEQKNAPPIIQCGARKTMKPRRRFGVDTRINSNGANGEIQARYWKRVYKVDAAASQKIPLYRCLLWSACK